MIENLIVGRNKFSVCVSLYSEDGTDGRVYTKILKQNRRDNSYWREFSERYTHRGGSCDLYLRCESSPQLSDTVFYLRGSNRGKDSKKCSYGFSRIKHAYSYANAIVRLITYIDFGRALSLEDYGYKLSEDGRNIIKTDSSVCEHCFGVFKKSELNQGRVCNKCISEYVECKRCNSLYPIKHSMLKIKDDEYCSECVLTGDEKMRNSIRSYNYRPSSFKKHGRPRNKEYFGVEIEAEINQETIDSLGVTKEDIASIVEKFNPHTYIVHDGSIRYGFEIVTQPCSYNFHKENTVDTMKMINDIGMFGDRTNSCGLHIHLSREAFKDNVHIGRFIWLFKTFEEEIYKFSRRTDKDWSYRYCKPVANVNTRESLGVLDNGSSSMDDLAYSFFRSQCAQDRYSTVNLQSPHTVEVRIFDGTTTPDIFLACLQFCKVSLDITRDSCEFSKKSFLEIYKNNYSELDKLISNIF